MGGIDDVPPYVPRSRTPKVTDAQCGNAVCPPDRKQALFADSGGMYLQVSPAGSYRWFLRLNRQTGF